MIKFELVKDDFIYPYLDDMSFVAYRIRALRDFGDVKKGDLGGYVEFKKNLSHNGNCWIYDDSEAIGKSLIKGNAKITGGSRVSGNAEVGGNVTLDCVWFDNGDIK